MLYRVSGKLTNGTNFASRFEATSVFGAFETMRAALKDASKADGEVAELRARPVKGGQSIRFADPNAPKRERKPKAATNGTAPAASAPSTAPASAPVAAAKPTPAGRK